MTLLFLCHSAVTPYPTKSYLVVTPYTPALPYAVSHSKPSPYRNFPVSVNNILRHSLFMRCHICIIMLLKHTLRSFHVTVYLKINKKVLDIIRELVYIINMIKINFKEKQTMTDNMNYLVIDKYEVKICGHGKTKQEALENWKQNTIKYKIGWYDWHDNPEIPVTMEHVAVSKNTDMRLVTKSDWITKWGQNIKK